MATIEITIEMAISVIAIGMSMAAFYFSRIGDAKDLEARLTKLETKIEPFWRFIQSELPNLITQETTPILDKLIDEHTNGGIKTKDSKVQLMCLLEEEYHKAKMVEDTGRAWAIKLYMITLGDK